MKYIIKIIINIIGCGAVFVLCAWMKANPSTTCIEAGGGFDYATGYCQDLSSPTQFYNILDNEFKFLLFFGIILSAIVTAIIWKSNKSHFLVG